jgi:arginine metabolism regulation protein II
VSGQHKDARSYLLDAEQLICIRGIPKAVKSRKVRLLHNIYLFLRVIEESTFIYSNTSSCVQHWSSQPPGDRREYQFPSLRTHCARLGKDLDDISSGCFETGLISQLENESPLFMEIYGIPTSLLSLLSKVTSLANKIDAHTTSSNNTNVPMAFATESKILENEVCTWELVKHAPEDGTTEAADVNFSANRSIIRHINLAIHNGVVMYFYRRIYNLNPMILQSYVDKADKALEHLLQCEQEKLYNNIVNCGIVWPGFIAAAEAVGDARQRKILRWLRDSAASSGLRNFDAAGDVVEELWRIRRTRPEVTWVDMLREGGTTLVLT